jgi:hypothetical protein
MAASKNDIKDWLDDGKRQGAAFMVVVCDTYDWEDFAVYVMPGEDIHEVVAGYSNPNQMLKVMEVYSYNQSLEAQLNQHRAYNLV